MKRKPGSVRRGEIKQAILAIVAEEGLAGLTTRHLSERVGVSEGALFRHFRTKKEMVLAVLDDAERQLVRELRAIATAKRLARDRLSDYLCAQVRYFTTHRGISLLLFAETAHLSDPQLREKVRGIVAGIRSGLETILQSGIERGEWADSVAPADVANLYLGIPLVLTMEMALDPDADVRPMCFRMHRLLLHLLDNARGYDPAAAMREFEAFARAFGVPGGPAPEESG